ncbi:oxygen-dependent tRNA uridine(34) hydroxylase TrhO [Flavimaricola marinus]|uniref:tRNA uridine(34) hydroxylase n=1 Tax=Flavimaricola marinus TaxID=1819565 RepID=A0A238LDN5_9RHOB|nr:rhodanese-related sulfurtransferase [Flavimaricola marinus]SMY07040.1 putative rhodanese-related sulfurtransferase [Flavimaricola marinus]
MFIVAALYQFTRFDDPAALRGPLQETCAEHGVTGTLLLAPEGINGTIAGPRDGIDAVLDHIRTLPGCADLEWKESTASSPPFYRMKVRLKREIVTMGQPHVAPAEGTGHYVAPEDWNDLIADPDVAVIDTRNDYEVAIGTFDRAVNPMTRSFGEFPEWWAANKDQFEGKRIAMFCTGGIRCEKSTNFLIQEGVSDVYHLKGGILKYLEEVPEEQSRWNGECFVFDNRVSVGHGLVEGPHVLCHACRRPLTPDDLTRNTYEPGVSCHHCVDETSAADKARFRERQRQMLLARERGEVHIGQPVRGDVDG